MPVNSYLKRTEMPVSRQALFDYHARPGALGRLLPPFQPVRVEQPGGIRDGERVVLRMGPGRLSIRWVAEHRDFVDGERFTDDQVSGPFARWSHTHLFLPHERDPQRSVLEDRVEYAPPLGSIGRALGGRAIERTLERMFRFRHERTYNDLAQQAWFGSPPMHVAVTGASGLVGRNLCAFLSTAGHRVTRIVRRPGPDDVGWDPMQGRLDPAALEGVDAVVHLAGESILGLRWTAAKKRAIRESRVRGTRLLADTFAKMASPPATLVSASAVGFYGDRPDEVVDESSAPGQGFLADVCRDWEAAALAAEQTGTRVVRLRIGVVLTASGGALAAQLPLFRLGLGGPVGHGRQGLSWIGLDDLIYAIHFVLGRGDVSGAVDATAPGAVSSKAFARELGRVLRRPAVLPAPAFALRWLLGEMAEEMLLGGAFARPGALETAGFRFTHPDLASSLAFELGRPPGGIGA